jgi:hypothetical protein
MIRPPGIDNGAFVVLPETVWYARVLLLFAASAKTDTGSKFFDCALVSTMETYDDPENGCYMYYMYYINFMCYMYYMHYMYYMYYMYYVYYIYYFVFARWLHSIGSQILYELEHRKPVLYVIPVEHILGKLPLVLVGDQARFRTTCATCFQVHLATAGRVLAMDAGCGSSTRGQWRGPVTCNEWEVEFGPSQPPCTILIE